MFVYNDGGPYKTIRICDLRYSMGQLFKVHQDE